MPLFLNVLVVIFVLLLFVAAFLIFRATLYGRVSGPIEPAETIMVDVRSVAEHLSAAIRQGTVSESDRTRILTRPFDDLRLWLERTYPTLHAALRRERINDLSLLYCWPGRAEELEPVLLMAHMDVVPVDSTGDAEWTHPPFSGEVVDGYVWGRGSLDTKSTLVTILEAVEMLVRDGYQPERTLYLAFGHDEEIGGWQGSKCIADWLSERGVRLAAVLDEGSGILSEIIPGVSVPAAMLGISEKGHATIELCVEGRAGHSSIPPRHTAIGVLARAIARIENHPMRDRPEMALLMFETLGPFLPFTQRLVLANPVLFGGLLRKRLGAKPTTTAAIRTTTAVTVIHGGLKDNIVPAQATALVNCRIIPGDSTLDVLEHVRKVVDDEAVQLRLPADSSWESSPISPVDSPVYHGLSRSIRQIFPEAVVAPYVVPGATDARHFTRICSNVFRFSPYVLDGELLKTVHGVNERIPVEALPRMVNFFVTLIKSWTTAVGRAE